MLLTVFLIGLGLIGIWSLNLRARLRCAHLPGPRPSWLVGNIFDFEPGKATQALCDWADRYGKLYVWYFGRLPCIVLSNPELIRAATIHNHNNLGSRMGPVISAMSLPERRLIDNSMFLSRERGIWRYAKATALPFFNRSNLENHCQKFNVAVDRILPAIQEFAEQNKTLNPYIVFGRMTLDSVSLSVLGVDLQKNPQNDTTAVLNKLLAVLQPFFKPFAMRGLRTRIALGFSPLLIFIQNLGVPLGSNLPFFRSLSRGRCFLWGLTHKLLENITSTGALRCLKTEESKNLPSIQFQSFSEGATAMPSNCPAAGSAFHLFSDLAPQKDSFICVLAINFILAGYETTAATISYCLHEVAQHAEVQQKMYEEYSALRAEKRANGLVEDAITLEDCDKLPFIRAVILETLRKWPLVTAFISQSRQVTSDFYLDGYKIPKNSALIFNAWHIHHNPEHFPEPDKFKPERFLAGHPEALKINAKAFLAFGIGPRECIGQKFAQYNIIVSLSKLIYNFEFSLDENQPPFDLITAITILPKDGFALKVKARKH